MINVGELVTDPDFCQTITYKRRLAEVVDHKITTTETTMTTVGVITIANDIEDEMVENGTADRNKEHIRVTTHGVLFVTGNSNSSQYLADLISFKGNWYKVLSCKDNEQYGYCTAIAERVEQEVI